MMLLLFVLVFGFVVGAVTIVAAEALGVFVFINRLNQKTEKLKQASESKHSFPDLDPQQSIHSASNKQGVVWVLEPEKIPKNWVDKAPRESKKKKEYVEVFPVKKYAKLKDKKLILAESDGSNSKTTILLKGCLIEAVSATHLPSRKWAKRFPIKLESKTSEIYNGSKTFYIYLETSWEKESWCKALRLASCNDKNRMFAKLYDEFHSYVTTLNAGYPSFMKPSSMGFNADPIDQINRPDGSSSKVRLLWRKLAKKTPKVGVENKSSGTSLSGLVDRKNSEKFRPSPETVSATGLVKTAPTMKRIKSEENVVQPSSSTFSHSGSQSHISVISDADSDDKFGNDEGTLCWNLLISRLFFDVKSNAEVKKSIQARAQRTLSNMRAPSYIGEVICTDIDLGNLPPHIHGMRVLPMDMNEVWSLEVDIEYSGGVVLDIETRLEVRELDLQKGIVDSNPESNSVGDVSSDLLEGFEYYGNQLNLAKGTADPPERKVEDGSKNLKSTLSTSANGSRWKSIVNSIAKQVSQVPLSLAIGVTSLRGTLRLHIKPPPSDQLWFGFTSMPDIDFNLVSSVGDHRITNGHIALFLVSRLKAAIRETLVLPNCETACIPWMIAEKDDWVPRKVAPFMWLHQEAINDPTTVREVPGTQPSEAKTKTEASRGTTSSDHPESKPQKSKDAECIQQPSRESSDESAVQISSSNLSVQSSMTLQELITPLLGNDEQEETSKQKVEEVPECESTSRSLTLLDKSNCTAEEDDLRPKRVGRRTARMLDIGKKMGEKLEEKRRHIEEKSRHIVEKMRGPP